MTEEVQITSPRNKKSIFKGLFKKNQKNETSDNFDQLVNVQPKKIKKHKSIKKIVETENLTQKKSSLLHMLEEKELEVEDEKERKNIVALLNKLNKLNVKAYSSSVRKYIEIYTIKAKEKRKYTMRISKFFPQYFIDDIKELNLSDENICYNNEKSNEIKCCTVDKIIEQVTHHKKFGKIFFFLIILDNNFLYTVLVTYRSFMTPIQLLSKLKVRYFTPPTIYDITAKGYHLWVRNFAVQVRLRIIQVLKTWISKHYHDFHQNLDLVQSLLEFLNDISDCKGTVQADGIINTLNRMVIYLFFKKIRKNHLKIEI